MKKIKNFKIRSGKMQNQISGFLATKPELIVILCIIFISIFITHLYSPYNQSGDSRWSIPTALSILNEGNTDLDEFDTIVQANSYELIDNIDGHLYTIFPIGVSILAIPVVFLYQNTINEQISSISNFHRTNADIEQIVASFIIAISGVILYLIVRRHLKIKYSFLVVFIFAFCTSAWSTASRALWQHGPSMLMLLISLYLILLAIEKPFMIQFVSIPLFFSYVTRPTNSISIVFLSLYVFIKYRSYIIKYILWGLLVVIPFLIYNLNVYNFILSPYYMPQRIGGNLQFFEALVGNLFSPGRGLFIFSPILFLAIIGIVLKIKHKRMEIIDCFLVAIVFFHWIAISSFPHWTAGWSFGPRFFSDMIPYFIYFLIPVLDKISESNGIRQQIVVSGFIILVAVSFFINFRGATDVETFLWNASLDGNNSKVWSWNDLQFLRGL